VPKPPNSAYAATFNSPASMRGTRHEYAQVPPQPNANMPDKTFFPP
jgi:hypothetical protein